MRDEVSICGLAIFCALFAALLIVACVLALIF